MPVPGVLLVGPMRVQHRTALEELGTRPVCANAINIMYLCKSVFV